MTTPELHFDVRLAPESDGSDVDMAGDNEETPKPKKKRRKKGGLTEMLATAYATADGSEDDEL